MSLAPIVIFVFNRPVHTRQTLEALALNELAAESTLYIFSDGATENENETTTKNIVEVRKVIREKKWCGTVNIVESPTNKGLAKSVIDGVTEIVNRYGKVIVLEDDLVTSPFFLTYMNEGLHVYDKKPGIYSVNGYMFPIQNDKNETVLLPYTSTWGWGTWKDRWMAFEKTMPLKDSIVSNPFLANRFNLADYPYTSMLESGNNSWGIYWYYSVFIRNGLCVFPTKSLVHNIGFDGSGVNHTTATHVRQRLSIGKINVQSLDTIDLDFFGKYLLHFTEKENSASNRTKRIVTKLFKKSKFDK